MKTVVEKITPDVARKYLECNYENRTIRQSWVASLVDTIQRGGWVKTHQGIAFDTTGRLVDGQHRLMAIAQSGRTVECLVSRDLREGSYRYIDAGKSRNLQDRIKLTEDPFENGIAVRITKAYCHATIAKASSRVSIDLVENQFLQMADEVLLVARGFRKYLYRLTVAPVGAAIAVYIKHHPEQGGEFLESFTHGTGLEKLSPVLTLREALLGDRVRGVHEQYWKTIQATKYHQRGTHLSALSASTEDWNGNEFTRMAQRRAATAAEGAETRKVDQIKKAIQ